MIRTARLSLTAWGEHHRTAFAFMHADQKVTADLGGPLSRRASDAKFDRYRHAFFANGVSRWAVQDLRGEFLGYAGIMLRTDPSHPLGVHHEIGWRFIRKAWGAGYASESARAALTGARSLNSISEIVSYTHPDNLRSQAVMRRLGLMRDPARDFTAFYNGVGDWRGLVWVATPAAPARGDVEGQQRI